MQQPVTLFLPDEVATEILGQTLAGHLTKGDVVLLTGEIGAGKSTLARAIIRKLLGSETEVPSPTFTLVQTYDDADTPIWHADLYRLTHADEVIELGLIEAAESAICLIEWPERVSMQWPGSPLTIAFALQGEGRQVQLTGNLRLVAACRT